MFRLITIAALVGFVSANTYSIGCISALMNLSSDPEVAACLNPSQLVPILVGAGNGQDSLVSPIDTWLSGFCASNACSQNAISNIVKNITQSCATEFQLSSDSSTMLDTVQKYYPTARKVMCLKDGDTMCVTQTLKNLEGLTAPFSLIQSDVDKIAALAKAGYPSSLVCTNCMKGSFTIVNQDLPGAISQDRIQNAANTCGASFTDGGIPPGLVQTAAGVVTDDGTSTSSAAPAPTSTTSSTIPASTAPAPAPTQTKKKSSAVGGPAFKLASSGLAGFVLPPLIAVWAAVALVA